MRKTAILRTAAVLCLAVCARVRAADEIKPGRLYIDPIRGFSLRPPADTARSRSTAANRLVTWSKRDKPGAPIIWRLSIYMRSDKAFKSGADLAVYGRDLAKRLARSETFQAAGPRIIEVAGAKAVNLRGVTTGRIRFWQRRVWIHRGGSKFLEIRISGPTDAKEKLDAIMTAVLKTVKLEDPKTVQTRRKTALTNGKELLKAFTGKKLAAIMSTKERWFLCRRGEDVAGYMLQTETAAGFGQKSGCRVKTWIVLNIGPKHVIKLRREMFTTADRMTESWTESWRQETGGTAAVASEHGTKNGARINCSATQDSKTTKNKPVDAPQVNYLPRAMAWLLHRMVDLKKPAAYAFATYNGGSGGFHLRTFTVIGPDEIEIGGRKVGAVRVTDQLRADAEATDMWLDADGNLLAMITADGLTMETAAKAAVLRRFSQAAKTIKAMGQ